MTDHPTYSIQWLAICFKLYVHAVVILFLQTVCIACTGSVHNMHNRQSMLNRSAFCMLNRSAFCMLNRSAFCMLNRSAFLHMYSVQHQVNQTFNALTNPPPPPPPLLSSSPGVQAVNVQTAQLMSPKLV